MSLHVSILTVKLTEVLADANESVPHQKVLEAWVTFRLGHEAHEIAVRSGRRGAPSDEIVGDVNAWLLDHEALVRSSASTVVLDGQIVTPSSLEGLKEIIKPAQGLRLVVTDEEWLNMLVDESPEERERVRLIKFESKLGE